MVTTHNPALLDAMGTEMVPFITVAHRKEGSGATELTLLEDIEAVSYTHLDVYKRQW